MKVPATLGDNLENQHRQHIARQFNAGMRRVALFVALYLLLVFISVNASSLQTWNAIDLLNFAKTHPEMAALALTPLFIVGWGYLHSQSLAQKLVQRLQDKPVDTMQVDTTQTVLSREPATEPRNTDKTRNFNLQDLLRSCVEHVTPLAVSKDIQVVVRIHQNLSTNMTGNHEVLYNVLMCLLDNAVKHTNRGEISLNVKMLEQFRNDMLLRFEVIDTGIGISREKQGRLFEAGTDMAETRSHYVLPDIKTLVESLGGGIGVYSQESQGSTFWFTAILQKRQPDDRPVTAGAIESSAA
ncbi:MAG: ATP-binding protein [Gammaproteobacteria bacterium]|nr:ATP-binding protein [Gammaproteobacteria bacterium]